MGAGVAGSYLFVCDIVAIFVMCEDLLQRRGGAKSFPISLFKLICHEYLFC